LSPRFAHEQLQVYGKALAFSAKASAWTGSWSKKHALVSQFYRASESLLLNLAEAARQHNGPARLQQAEYAIGSSLECAGCLDLAVEKGLVDAAGVSTGKELLRRVSAMLEAF